MGTMLPTVSLPYHNTMITTGRASRNKCNYQAAWRSGRELSSPPLTPPVVNLAKSWSGQWVKGACKTCTKLLKYSIDIHTVSDIRDGSLWPHMEHTWQDMLHNEMHDAFWHLWGSKVTFWLGVTMIYSSASHYGANCAIHVYAARTKWELMLGNGADGNSY